MLLHAPASILPPVGIDVAYSHHLGPRPAKESPHQPPALHSEPDAADGDAITWFTLRAPAWQDEWPGGRQSRALKKMTA
jgi:hypothetical protein